MVKMEFQDSLVCLDLKEGKVLLAIPDSQVLRVS
jgi:hypothetical protein